MTNFEGILGRVIAEKKETFRLQLEAALIAKYGSAEQLPRGEITALAKACEVKPMTIYLWRAGDTFPSDKHIKQLAKHLGISVRKLVGNELYKYYEEKGE